MGVQTYFTQAEHPLTIQSILSDVYTDPTKDRAELFCRVNGVNPKAIATPGQVLIIPGMSGLPDEATGRMSAMQAELGHGLRNSSLQPAPRLFNENFTKYAGLGIGAFKDFAGANEKVVTMIFKSMKEDLKGLNQNLMTAAGAQRGPGGLGAKTPRFSVGAEERKVILQRLEASARKLNSTIGGAKASAETVADAKGISHKAVKRSFKTSGAASEVKAVKGGIANVDDAMKKVGSKTSLLGVSMTAAGGALTIYDYYHAVEAAKVKDPRTADIVALHEGGKAIGGVAGGWAGGELGVAGGALLVVMLGTPVGWASIAIVGVAAIAGGAIVGYGGTKLGGYLAEQGMLEIDPSRKAEIKMITNPLP